MGVADMFASIGRSLKTVLIGLLLYSNVASAAEFNVAADNNFLGSNKADIGVISTVNGNNNMGIVINPGGQGCTAGQYWDINAGGCTSAVMLRTEATSRSCTCTCPELGSCTSSQNGSYPVYGWRLPPSGVEQVGSYGATAWGACSVTTSSCVADTSPTAPGSPGPPGTVKTIIVANLICDSSSPYYSLGGATDSQKLRIIDAYKLHVNKFGRCPEFSYAGYDGWVYWQGFLVRQEKTIADVELAIKTASVPDSDVQTVVDAACKDGANSVYGSGTFASATYIRASGNKCNVTF